MNDADFRCVDCDRSISINSSKCLNCGREYPTMRNAVWGSVKGIVLALVFVVFSLALPQWFVDDVGGPSTWYFIAVVTAVGGFVASFGPYWVRSSVIKAHMKNEKHPLETIPTPEEWLDENYPEWTKKIPGHEPENNREDSQ